MWYDTSNGTHLHVCRQIHARTHTHTLVCMRTQYAHTHLHTCTHTHMHTAHTHTHTHYTHIHTYTCTHTYTHMTHTYIHTHTHTHTIHTYTCTHTTYTQGHIHKYTACNIPHTQQLAYINVFKLIVDTHMHISAHGWQHVMTVSIICTFVYKHPVNMCVYIFVPNIITKCACTYWNYVHPFVNVYFKIRWIIKNLLSEIPFW